jgi:hypothetical protein
MKQTFPNDCLAASLGGGWRSQGGAQQGTRARGEQYLDGVSRSHTLAPKQLFGIAHTNNFSATCPFFRSKPRVLLSFEDDDENEDEDDGGRCGFDWCYQCGALPNAIRRYSRLQICATTQSAIGKRRSAI